ncbi:hypothetical protein K470DRAFT_264031 [Piedraia hortae CBS 480.64]|uniref:Uncharacterized protein n=1 Tax=Piedraia hortae CBS 480.64 TaxID=1314780 RepID=A0A6A7C0V2_9PEZI|nr:hypothetical protein K470DRAFT_264031 [Piedraia hortae CBS 480.64]
MAFEPRHSVVELYTVAYTLVWAMYQQRRIMGPINSGASTPARAVVYIKRQGGRTFGITQPLGNLYPVEGFDPHRDFPYEVLHCPLMGTVKYIWSLTKSHPLVAKDMSGLALHSQASNKAGLDSDISAEHLTKWSVTFTGNDWHRLIQTWPAVLTSFYTTKGRVEQVNSLLKVWYSAAELIKMLYDDVVEDAMRLAERFLQAWEAVLGLKTIQHNKLHLLFHFPMWVDRFSPIIGATAQSQEGANKHTREQAGGVYQPHAVSRHVATSMALLSGIQHMAEGGW